MQALPLHHSLLSSSRGDQSIENRSLDHVECSRYCSHAFVTSPVSRLPQPPRRGGPFLGETQDRSSDLRTHDTPSMLSSDLVLDAVKND